MECLRAAQVVVYDYLANKALLAYARPDAELIYAGKSAAATTRTRPKSTACW